MFRCVSSKRCRRQRPDRKAEKCMQMDESCRDEEDMRDEDSRCSQEERNTRENFDNMFRDTTMDFETKCTELKHYKCLCCRSVTLRTDNMRGNFCIDCQVTRNRKTFACQYGLTRTLRNITNLPPNLRVFVRAKRC